VVASRRNNARNRARSSGLRTMTCCLGMAGLLHEWPVLPTLPSSSLHGNIALTDY
jgi:hypothetical protein